MSPVLAQEIVIDHERREIRIDGQLVPWFIARQEIEIVVGEVGAVSTVLLPVLARNVRVIGTPVDPDAYTGATSSAHSNRLMQEPPRNELSDILDRIGSEADEPSGGAR